MQSAAAAEKSGGIAERPRRRWRLDPRGGRRSGTNDRPTGGFACRCRLSPCLGRNSRRAQLARCVTGKGLMMRVMFQLNRKPVEVEVEPRMHLADCLRDELRQTGTHLGCEQGVCGACTIIVDGAAVRSCLMLAAAASGAVVETVEGLADGGELNPLQRAFRRHHAVQCGFCTSGFLMSITAALRDGPVETEDQA